VKFEPGDMLSERFRVIEEVGRGGMGLVLLAEDIKLGRNVAIKLLLPDRDEAFEAELVERFLREARTVAGMESPHIVRLFHTDQLPGGAPYIVMELLRGDDLQSVLARSGRLRLDEAVWFALQACAGLAEAHRRGIIHRDLKPANLFLDKRSSGPPNLKILDFGIAKVTMASAVATGFQTTAEGKVLGTPLYMSPEQRGGEAVDVRTDIWALGVLLYELVTGSLPFPSENLFQLEHAVRTADPVPLSTHLQGVTVPQGFEEVLQRCLAKAPEDRYQNVAQLALALSPFGPAEAAALARTVADSLGLEDIPEAKTTSNAPTIHETMLQWKTTMMSTPQPGDPSGSGEPSTPMASEAALTPTASTGSSRRGLVFAAALAAIAMPAGYLASSADTFAAQVELRSDDDGGCPGLPSTAKLVADWGSGSRSTFLDAECNASLPRLPADKRGAVVSLRLSGAGAWVLSSGDRGRLSERILLSLAMLDAPPAAAAAAAEPAPVAEAPAEAAPAMHRLRVTLKASGKTACPKDVRGAELRVDDRVVRLGDDCSVGVRLPAEAVGTELRFALDTRCHRIGGGERHRVESEAITLGLSTKPACRAKAAPRCAKPCQCWDEKNNPCACLYPCADDCTKSESLCAAGGARR